MRLSQLILAASVAAMAAPAAAQYVPHMATSAHAAPASPVYRVDLNKTQIVRLPMRASSIVVGNPQIADISVHSQSMLFVVGRGYGETNLVILDEAGNTMMDANIQVTSVTPSHGVRVFDGSSRRTFSCAPYCQPSPILGDDAGFIGANSGAEEETSGLEQLFGDLLGGGGDTTTVPTTVQQPGARVGGF